MPPQASPPGVGPTEPFQPLQARFGVRAARPTAPRGVGAGDTRPRSMAKRKPVAHSPGQQGGHAASPVAAARRGAAGDAAERGQMPDQTKHLTTALYVALRAISGAGLTA